MCEQLVNDNPFVSSAHAIRGAGRSSGRFTGCPGARVPFSITGSCQHERMASAIGCDGIRRITAIVHLEQNRVAIVSQPQRAGTVLQAV